MALILNGRYKILRKIGEGGAGTVFLAEDTLKKDKILALKKLHPSFGSKENYRSLKIEFDSLAKFNHPNLVRIFDLEKIKGKEDLFLTMEYIDGKNLAEISDSLREEELLDVIAQICRALDYIHRRGIIHRDIKPENILIIRENEKLTVRLMDFGLASAMEAAQSEIGGTLLYAAPEILKGKTPDGRSDLYSLGMIFYLISFGKYPFPASEPSDIIDWHLRGELSLQGRLKDNVPAFMPELISLLLQKDPSRRLDRAYKIIDFINEKSGLALKLETRESMEGFFKSADFIGRNSEFDEILRNIDLIKDARVRELNPLPTLLLIEGESGIGKSRLLREVKNRCQLGGLDVLTGYCYEGGISAYGPFVDIIKHALPLSHTIQTSFKDTRSLFKDDLRMINHFLVARERVPKTESQKDNAEKEKLKLADSISGFIYKISDAFPLILFLEDLHWADEGTLFLLEFLTRNARGKRILLVATLRKEESCFGRIAKFLSKSSVHASSKRIDLRHLNREEVFELVSAMIGKKNEVSILANEIFRKTDGNPFFIEQVMRSIAEDVGAETESDWQDKVLTYKKQISIPATMHDAILKRIARIDEKSIELLKYLAIINKPSTFVFLTKCTAWTEGEMKDLLANLMRREIIRAENDGERAYIFSHNQIREYILESIAGVERTRIHSRVAHALLECKEQEPILEDLAYHFVQAEEKRQALIFSIKAAERSGRIYAHERAIEHYNNALCFLPKDSQREKVDILFNLAQTHLDLGAFDKGISIYREIIQFSNKENLDSDLALAQERLGWAYCIERSLLKGKEFSEKAYQLYQKLRNQEGMANALNNLGLAHARMGLFAPALDYFQRSLTLWKRLGNSLHMINLINNVGITYFNLGNIQDSIAFLKRALADSEKHHHKKMSIASFNNLGIIYKKMNMRKEAIECYERCLVIEKETGNKFNMAITKHNLSELYKMETNYERSLSSILEAINFAEHLGNISSQAFYSNNTGDIYQHIGRFEDSKRFHKKAFELSKECGDRTQEAYSLLSLAGDYILEENIGEAKSLIEEAFQISEQLKNSRIRFKGLLHLMKASNAEKDFSKTKRSYHEIIRLMGKSLLDAEELCEAKILYAVALKEARESEKASKTFMEALKIAEEKEMKEKMLLANYHLGMISLDGKDSLKARDYLIRSREILDNISSTFKSKELMESYLNHPERKKIIEQSEQYKEGQVMTEPTQSGEIKAPPAKMLATLYEIVQLINSILDPDELLEKLMDLTIETVKAERGLIILVDESSGEMSIKVARNLEKETIKDASRYSQSIVKEAGAGKSILTLDAINDSRFKKSKSVSLYKIHSLMCVPMKIKERVIGTVYLDSRKSGPFFTHDDLAFVEALANHAAIAIEKAQLYVKLKIENALLKDVAHKIYKFDNIIGKSQEMKRVFSMIERVMESSLPVLIIGESGTGKELVARAIHFNGPRRNNIFLSENCSAISETLLESELFGHVRGSFTGAISDRKGLFELASHGTLFLDEIGDMSLSMQSKLLRALQEGEIRPIGSKKIIKVNPRIISASHMDLKRLIDEGKFREDLYYRLNVIQINIPPLRDRKTDIPMLVEHFLGKAAIEKRVKAIRIDDEVLSLFIKYRWPGNVRELENTINRLSLIATENYIDMKVLKSDRELYATITASYSKQDQREEPTRRTTEKIGSIRDKEKEMIVTALGEARGNKLEAARILGISRATIFRKIREYGIR
ncbi:MAG: sigma 54-interacting transcriptional regulator [Acidobacteriota bacterium]